MPDTNLNSISFHIEHGFRPQHRQSAATGYWAAFSGKLQILLGPNEKAIPFISSVLDPSHAISAVSEDGKLLGIAGFKTATGAFVGGGFKELIASYGMLGAIARGILASALERSIKPGTLLMDGIFVQREARGLGVGTALLKAIEHHAKTLGLTKVRLDVIDTNPHAKRLYERSGFRAEAVQSTGIFRPVFGFRTATTMVKPIQQSQA